MRSAAHTYICMYLNIYEYIHTLGGLYSHSNTAQQQHVHVEEQERQNRTKRNEARWSAVELTICLMQFSSVYTVAARMFEQASVEQALVRA